MADIAASNVTYSFSIRDKTPKGRLGWEVNGTIAFGNGSLNIPSGGIPLTKAKMGLPRRVRKLRVIESSQSGYLFEYDVSAEKLLISFPTDQTTTVGDRVGADAAGTAPSAMTLVVDAEGY